MADFNRADLDFILRQIRIAELNRTREDANGAPVAGVPITDLVESPLLPFGLRTVDGRNNNIVPGREDWGAADTLFPRILPPDFRPAEGGTTYDSVTGTVIDSQPRVISNLIADQTLDNIAAIAAALAPLALDPDVARTRALSIHGQWEDLKDKVAAAGTAATAAAGALALLNSETSQLVAAQATQAAYNSAANAIGSVATEFGETNSAIDTLAVALTVGALVDQALLDLIDAVILNAQEAVGFADVAYAALLANAGASAVDRDAAQVFAQAANELALTFLDLKGNLVLSGTVGQSHIDALAAANSILDGALTADQLALDGALDGQVLAWGSTVSTEQGQVDAAQTAYDQAVAAGGTATSQLNAARALLDDSLLSNEITIEHRFRPANLPGGDPILDQYGSLVITNVAPDEGISAPFNSWMTLFGQFFDHGLDLVAKGDSGTVFIPILPGDPLYVPGGATNFMTLTRATNQTGPGADGILGTADDTQREHLNTTTAWVDQNQTYTSHASHQVFLRDYDRVSGQTVATGHLLDGAAQTMATWTEVKAQALEMLGLKLSDYDVNKVPLLATDEYGRFLRGPNGYAQVVVRTYVDESDPLSTYTERLVEGTATGLDLEALDNAPNQAVVRTGHAFLDDIAHAAGPFDAQTGARKIEDGDTGVGITTVLNPYYVEGFTGTETWKLEKRLNVVVNPRFDGTEPTGTTTPAATLITDRPYLKLSEVYDGELLGRHFMTGDGRGNENIGLTAVHDVFHSEHNRLADQTKDLALEAARAGDIAFLNEWLREDLAPTTIVPTEATAYAAFVASLQWDGERLFQAARVGTEMQYQHLVFEEFARKVTPSIDLFVFNSTVDVNPAIFAEFAHVVYRFGHSMLTETVDRVFDANTQESMTLVDAFLNPVAFNNDGGLSADAASGALVRGMMRQAGNAIDEHVTDALRNFLVGVPLDLPALNIARGRDTGVPSLNAAREAFFAESNSQWVRPYTSWTDFQDNLKNPLSVVNFIAAYGTHASLQGNLTTEQKRDAALRLVFGDELFDGPAGLPATPGVTVIRGVSYTDADVTAFLNGSGSYALNKGGLDNVDLWIGGLAERTIPFGGMLGATFTYVFEKQLENLQNGDRFYYLSRMQGTHFLTELESNSFAEVIMNNTELNGAHLPGEIFSTPHYILEVNTDVQNDYNPDVTTPDAEGLDPTSGVTRETNFDVNGVTYANYLRFVGGEHVVLGGTNGVDALIAGLGDDTLWGDDGNDLLIGGDGINRTHGGAGNDRIFDGGDAAFLHGEDGDDFISAGAGAGELIFGDAGNDYILMGSDLKEAFAGEGNDFVLGTGDVDIILGGEGDDWLEGGEGFDTTAGDNSELFFNSAIVGHDVMFAGTNEHDFDAESGDDIMVQGESVMRSEGMFGFDWSIYKGNNIAANADLRVKIESTAAADVLRNRFDKVEALSGWRLNDRLIGDSRVEPTVVFDPNGVPVEGEFFGDGLDRAGVERVTGLREVLGLTQGQLNAFEQTDIVFQGGNILISGDGNDFIQGNGGNDIVDGDRWLNVRIAILDNTGVEIGSVERLAPREVLASNTPALNLVRMNDTGHAWNGRSITSLVESGTITGSNMRIVREILTDATPGNNTDTAAFRGNRDEYTTVVNADGSMTVTHTTPATVALDDGVDTLRGIERLHFADGGLFSASINENAANTGGMLVGRMVREFTSGTVTFGGPDAGRFSYNATTGDVRFNGSNLDFEAPSDLNRDNVFTATLTHLSAAGQVYVDYVEVAVNNVGESNAGTMRIGAGLGLPVAGANPETSLRLNLADVRTDQDLVSLANPTGAVNQVANYRWQQFTSGTWSNVNNGGGISGATTEIVSGLAGGRYRLRSTHTDPGSGTVIAFSEDVYVGTSGSQTVTAGSTSEWVFGLNGNDTLNGGLGADSMFGGLGDDTYLVDSIEDVATEAVDAGTDLVRATVNFSLVNALEVENLMLEGTALIGTGNILNNIIFGTDGSNELDGGDGDDALYGGNGNDFLYGGHDVDFLMGEDGNDVLDGGEMRDLVYGGGGEDVLLGDYGDDHLVGGAQRDWLYGGEDADVLMAEDGDDYATGENGNDWVYGEAGKDMLLGGDGDDVVGGGVGDDTVMGGAGADALFGEDGVDFLYGEAGNDYVVGGRGYNLITLGAGLDIVQSTRADAATHYVYDFSIADGDQVWLVGSTLTSAEEVAASAIQVGNDAFVMNGTDMVVLAGVSTSQLTAANFALF